MGSVFLLEGKVQHYNWGGVSYIPALLGVPNPEERPFAEYWLGAHPVQPGLLQMESTTVALPEFIEEDRRQVLGPYTADRFGQLPFLFKVLDVRQMLSIQVHPNKEQGQEGYERENREGIPLTANHRNYKDSNHKPELMVALSDFWLLHGFKPEGELRQTLESVPEFASLIPLFSQKGYKGLYEYVMLADQAETDSLLGPLKERIYKQAAEGGLQKSSPHFWAHRAMETYGNAGRFDRGIFSIYFFNLLHLTRGEGIFQDAGLPHAYLEGQNVEVMANSDNVLRAGLTEKFIDVTELLKLVKFEPTYPQVIPAREAQRIVYSSPAAEFELTRYRLQAEEAPVHFGAAAIAYNLSGNISIKEGDSSLGLGPGQAAFILAGSDIVLSSTREADLFVVSVPEEKK